MAGTIRYFDGGRGGKRVGAASELMRLEIMKKGKLPAADRYKQIMKKKLEENKKKALGPRLSDGFRLPGSIQEAKKLSKRAEQNLQQMAEKKARKEAKALRQMVVVQPRVFSNGTLNKKGQIYDIAGNQVAKINIKNGNMSSMLGWSFGKYNPKSVFTNMAIQNAINQYSPYFINQRKLQMLQQQGGQLITVHGPVSEEVINVHGPAINAPNNFYGTNAEAQRQNVAATAWGVRSDNIWGSFSDNAHGTFADNVWGGNYSDVWGGIGASNSMWGQKGPNVWGTGNGINFLRGITNALAGFFGFSTKKNRERLAGLNRAARSGSAPTRTAAPTRR